MSYNFPLHSIPLGILQSHDPLTSLRHPGQVGWEIFLAGESEETSTYDYQSLARRDCTTDIVSWDAQGSHHPVPRLESPIALKITSQVPSLPVDSTTPCMPHEYGVPGWRREWKWDIRETSSFRVDVVLFYASGNRHGGSDDLQSDLSSSDCPSHT